MKLKALAVLLLSAVGCFGQSPYNQSIFPAQSFTATAQTGSTIALNGATGTAGSSFGAGTITVKATSLTTVTFAVMGSADGGATFYALPITAVSAGATAGATATATAAGLFQVSLVGITHVQLVTSGTFTASGLTLTLTATPQVTSAHKRGGTGLPNPLAFWKINEGSGVTANDSGPSGITLTSSGVIDVTAVINNWSASPSQGFTAPLAVFAGPGTIPLASVGQAPASINFDGTKPFSASFWLLVNAASGGTEFTIFGDLQAAPAFTGWEIFLDGGGEGLILALYNNIATSNGIVVGMNQASIPLAQANHFVATYDGSRNASGIKWYMNGVLQSTTTYLNGLTASSDSTSPMLIGARIDNSSNLGQGSGAIMKYVELFPGVLTQSQVTALFAAGN